MPAPRLAFITPAPLSAYRPATTFAPRRAANPVPRHGTRRALGQTTLSAASPQPGPQPLSLNNLKLLKVDQRTGNLDMLSAGNPVQIESAYAPLPDGNVPYLPVSTDRSATAMVYAPLGWLKQPLTGRKAVIFAHGFSQRPVNYSKWLRRLAVAGYIVAAPRTWLLDVVWPWVNVETVGRVKRPEEKLQTAVLIDIARTLQLLRDAGATEFHLAGHSMGGAMALAYLGKTPASTFHSAFLCAPAVGIAVLTQLNQSVALFHKGGPGDKSGEERMRDMAAQMAPIDIISLRTKNDSIVHQSTIQNMFDCLKDKKGLTGYGELAQGTHVGYENSLYVDLGTLGLLLGQWGDWIMVLFWLIDLIVYGPCDVFSLDSKEQLESTEELCLTWMASVGAQDPAKAIEQVVTPIDVDYQWEGNP